MIAMGGSVLHTTEPDRSFRPNLFAGRTLAGELEHSLSFDARSPIFSSISILPFIGVYPRARGKASGKRRDFTVAARQQGKTEAARIRGRQGTIIIDEFFGVAP